jgi:glycosyltransferase involved in cell wall biosynthesis
MSKTTLKREGKINIVLFWFMSDWGKYGRAYEKIAEHLAKLPEVRRVVCMFPPKKVEQGHYAWPFTFTMFSKKLFLLTPNTRIVPTLTAPYRLRHWLNKIIPDFSLKQFLRLQGFMQQNTILWMFPAHHYINKLISLIPHSLLITQVVDNNTFRENDSTETISFVKQQYEELTKHSDIVLTSSKINYELFSAMNTSCYYFENAVDQIFISSPSELPYKLNKTRPRLGYVGFITQRTDIKLLDYVARSRPGYDLIIAGPQGENLNKYGTLNLPNVTYEGPIPYNAVPKFLQAIDVCLIPHKDTLYSKSMSPLKLFQYLGSGKPIVSTAIAGVERWDGLISIASNYTDFVENIDTALKEDNKELSNKRVTAAKLETWDKRVEQIFRVVMGHFLKNQNKQKH